MKVGTLLDLECSYFNNTYSRPVKTVTVRSLFNHEHAKTKLTTYDWTDAAIKKTINCTSTQLDALLAAHVKKHGKDDFYTKLKEYQLAVTPSGLFGERRTYEYLQEVNPLVVVDIDDVKVDKAYIDKFKKYPWIVGAGESMSRKGAWLLCYIEEAATFKEHFLAIRKLFESDGIKADDLKDTTRLRYLSYGYNWVRKDSEAIKPFADRVALPSEDVYETKQLKPTTQHDTTDAADELINSTGSIDEAGGLHPWTVRIAARCNRKGMSMTFAMSTIWDKVKKLPIIKDTPRYTQERFNHDFRSIYELYKHEHHIQTKVRISKTNVSRFDEKIYKRSPQVLQELVDLVDQTEEKEVVYFTALMQLGVLFPNRCFRYFNNTYYPNLYGYILGEAASFKGKAKIIRTALKPYQQRVDEIYKERSDQRTTAINYNKSNKDASTKMEVAKVPDLNFFFDGNTSSAAMLKAMQDSPVLNLFETEGDTITKTWKTDWGNYSDILRKAFEHESLYSLKKNGAEENLLRIRIERPKLSVLVSSTENQMRKVLNGDETENGLMSRFLFYIVQNDKKWYNGWDANTDVDIEGILKNRVSPDTWMLWTTQPDIYFHMSKEAYQYHQEYFNWVNDNWPDELFQIISLVRRSGTACARIALLLEELQNLDNGKKRGGLVARSYSVSGESMLLAIDIMKVLLQHLFVAWQITYRQDDLKETNIQDSETRNKVADVLTQNPKAGYKAVASAAGISRDLARYHVKALREEGGKGEG
jgi:hypothetical protein